MFLALYLVPKQVEFVSAVGGNHAQLILLFLLLLCDLIQLLVFMGLLNCLDLQLVLRAGQLKPQHFVLVLRLLQAVLQLCLR